MSQHELLHQWVTWLAPSETAAAFLGRVRLEPLITGTPLLDRLCPLPLRPGHVVEVAGPSGSGKTDLLVQVCLISAMEMLGDGVSVYGVWSWGRVCPCNRISLKFRTDTHVGDAHLLPCR